MARVYRRGESYYITWQEEGRQRKRSLGRITKREAKTIEKAKELELLTGEKTLTLRETVTVKGVLNEYLDWHEGQTAPKTHDRTLQIWEDHLLPVFGDTALDNLTNRNIEAFLIKRSKAGAKQGELEKEFNVLRALVTWCVDNDITTKKRFSRIKIPKDAESKPKRVYTAEELQQIYEASPNHWWLWKFVANTGIRLSEAAQVRKSDLRAGTLWVLSTEDERTKSAKWRRIPLGPGALSAAEELAKRSDTEYLFPRMYRQSVGRAFKTCLQRAGVHEPVGSFHSLRHTFITHMIMKGVPLSAVQELAGHSNQSTTEGYIKLTEQFMTEATEGLDL